MKFSIIIPVYNVAKYLRPCLDSVLVQTERDWECICIDDGSTDGSAAILDEYAANDRRFHVVHKKNEGVAVARNVGLDLACGDWITWLDADDEYAPWRLEEAWRIVEIERPDLVRFRTRFIGDGYSSSRELVRTGECCVFDGDDAKIWCWDRLLPAGMMWTFVAKRDLFEGNRFVPGMRVKEELPVCARIATRVGRVVQSEAEAYVYRQIDSSAMHSRKTSDECIAFLEMVNRLMEEVCFKEGQMSLPVYEAMRRRVRMHCECDIIDWVRKRARSDHGQREIFAAYRRLKEFGLLNCSGIQQYRYRLPVWWWDKTGQIWTIKFIVRVERIVRSLVHRC